MEKATRRIADRLKTIRLQKGLTQSELAERANINSNYYAKLERGEVTASIPMLERIADTLNIDISEMFAAIHKETGEHLHD
jgi:transcriptional regulator with XRE-family HTH domain